MNEWPTYYYDYRGIPHLTKAEREKLVGVTTDVLIGWRGALWTVDSVKPLRLEEIISES